MKAANDGMPTFFVIGAAKCGTTSLHYYLNLHPEISMSQIKEPMFFLPQEVRDAWSLDSPANARSEYLALFEADTQVRGEASTAYSKYPMVEGVPEAIHAEVPDAKIIYSVRDPIERVPSSWVQTQQTRQSSNRRGKRVASLSEMVEPFDGPDNHLVWPGMYMTQLKQYLEYFPERSIMVVDSHELKRDRESVMSEVFAFLGVDPEFRSPRLFEERNTLATKVIERDLYARFTESRILRRLVDGLPESARDRTVESVRRSLSKSAEKPVIDPVLRKRLKEHFRPEVDELREFSGLPFASWSV